jgi:hypothetical protein
MSARAGECGGVSEDWVQTDTWRWRAGGLRGSTSKPYVACNVDRACVQVEMVFHNVTYLLTVSAGADDTLCVEVEQKDDGARWRGDFTMRCV